MQYSRNVVATSIISTLSLQSTELLSPADHNESNGQERAWNSLNHFSAKNIFSL